MNDVLMSDAEVARRVLQHIERGTTDLGEEVWREPVEHYRSPARFEAELRDVLRRTATPFCPSAALPEVGSYLARTAAGVPILALRDEDGAVRAYRNACRHRGAMLVDGSGCAKGFVCPYHGWSYALDGHLRRVPHEQGFPGLDKTLHGLVPVRAVERLGLVFVTQDGEEPPAEALPALIGPRQQLFATRELEVAANWKIFLESFIEGYHIRALHRETFFPYGFDNLNVIEHFGRNSRVTFPFRRIDKLADLPEPERRIEGRVTYVYHLFPNAFVIVFSHHTSLVVLEPLAVDRTRLLSWSLTNRGPADAEVLETARRDMDFVDQTGTAEDRAIVAAIQRGLASGANEVFTFGRCEPAIVHFHRTLKATLAERRRQ